MSGEGLISVRLPRSLLGVFRASTDRQGITVHHAARTLIAGLESLTPDNLKALREPPSEADAPRVSLYIGWDLLDALADATRKSNLTNSRIVRRLLYGFLVSKQIEFVQQHHNWKLQIVSTKHNEHSSSERGEI